MVDYDVNGAARKAQSRHDGFDPDEVQAEIDRMLAKDYAGNAAACAGSMPVLQSGDTGDCVAVLQNALKYMGYLTVEPDGIFGNYTLNALKAFQKNIAKVYGNFAVDGICGPKTWTRLLAGK